MTEAIEKVRELVEALHGHKQAVNAAYRVGKDAAADGVFVAAIKARPALETLLAENERLEVENESLHRANINWKNDFGQLNQHSIQQSRDANVFKRDIAQCKIQSAKQAKAIRTLRSALSEVLTNYKDPNHSRRSQTDVMADAQEALNQTEEWK